MTYSLFEFVKEKFEELIEEQPEGNLDNIEKLAIVESDQVSISYGFLKIFNGLLRGRLKKSPRKSS